MVNLKKILKLEEGFIKIKKEKIIIKQMYILVKMKEN